MSQEKPKETYLNSLKALLLFLFDQMLPHVIQLSKLEAWFVFHWSNHFDRAKSVRRREKFSTSSVTCGQMPHALPQTPEHSKLPYLLMGTNFFQGACPTCFSRHLCAPLAHAVLGLTPHEHHMSYAHMHMIDHMLRAMLGKHDSHHEHVSLVITMQHIH